MKIYSMTATFGKLERQTLTLQPGLNIIEAPNEWGKSTWCAFITAMLYGIETKARTTQSTLADKEHYAPWSGTPMEGRMDLCWNGRNITIERRTKGKVPFGEFRAYETESGLEVPELTAANCGMELLGVERSVFVRAGFLKLTDMPVTQDDALRRRLNNLVTTGDESGAGEKLAQSLKELKNKCKSNSKNGLLPQAEAERDKIEEQLHTLQELNAQAERIQTRQKQLEIWTAQLENHKIALNYAAAQEKSQHIREAEAARDRLAKELGNLEAECSALPAAENAQKARTDLQNLHNESMSLQMELQMLPSAPTVPQCDKCFEGLTGDQAVEQAKNDAEQAGQVKKAKKSPLTGIGIAAVVVALISVVGVFLPFFLVPDSATILPLLALTSAFLVPMLLIIGGVAFVLGIVLFVVGSVKKKKCNALLDSLTAKYETAQTELWISAAEEFAQKQKAFEEENAQYQQMVTDLQKRREALVADLQTLTGGEAIGVCLEKWEQVEKKWQMLADAHRDLQRAESQLTALRAVGEKVSAPTEPDSLTQTLSETEALLTSAAFEMKQNQLRLGQFQGQAEALGQETALKAQLKQVRGRISRLEETYAALEVAQEALRKATNELQRRFAPRIAKRTQELFGKLTAGRYEKVLLAEDLSIHVSAQDEIAPRSSQWRSDGTVDQLYLALRLAVAEELTPDAPLVLDDAMVRFDDRRLAAALHILGEMADNTQVILFTCQSREKKLQGEL